MTNALFRRGTGGARPYPPLAEVRPVYDAAQAAVEAAARSADLTRALETRNFKTVGDALSFNMFHRGYHIGKICPLRALMGRQPLFT